LGVIVAIDHVQVVAPPGGVDEARRFYVEVIGLEEIARPPTMGGTGAWFRVGRQELHVSEHEDFAPVTKAHPAFEVSTEELDALANRIAGAHGRVEWDDRLPGARRFYAFDAAGNRLEFLARG
jgi:catechol 2,3-dioxygenase-like lactoylglutathione lyase family enzyme